jgi:spore coat protein A, manganese oxidase
MNQPSQVTRPGLQLSSNDSKGSTMKSRRQFLKQAGMVSAAATLLAKPNRLLAMAKHRRHHIHRIGPPHHSPNLKRFLDQLPIPPVLQPKPGQVLDIGMKQFRQKLHPQLPPTVLWGYDGIYPGPTIEARQGVPVQVNWRSYLPTTHFLPVDHTIHGAGTDVPDVRTVVHLHGHKILPESDGYPEAWFTSDGKTGPDFYPGPYVYPNDQRSTMQWYHDHGLGITRLNVYAGLAGLYFIRSAEEDALNLPSGKYEIPLLIQDRSFNPDGSLSYPTAKATHDFWVPEFFGDTVLVNGKVWPYVDVGPRKYRLRIVNGSNARFYRMQLVTADQRGNTVGNPGPTIWQIGTDGGLLPSPVAMNQLLIGPAERFDLVVDFSSYAGMNLVFTNDARAPFPDGDDVIPDQVMLFRVGKHLKKPDSSSLPETLSSRVALYPAQSVQQRTLTLTELDREEDGFPIIGMLDGKMWDDPVTENPKAGTIEVWNLLNATEDAHPKHIHLVQFQILDRQPFDEEQYESNGQLIFTGPPQAPDPNEVNAWKDTVKSWPGTVTRVIAKFDLPSGTDVVPGKAYRYVWHCHILEHEDNEMMRPYDVIG